MFRGSGFGAWGLGFRGLEAALVQGLLFGFPKGSMYPYSIYLDPKVPI